MVFSSIPEQTAEEGGWSSTGTTAVRHQLLAALQELPPRHRAAPLALTAGDRRLMIGGAIPVYLPPPSALLFRLRRILNRYSAPPIFDEESIG